MPLQLRQCLFWNARKVKIKSADCSSGPSSGPGAACIRTASHVTLNENLGRESPGESLDLADHLIATQPITLSDHQGYGGCTPSCLRPMNGLTDVHLDVAILPEQAKLASYPWPLEPRPRQELLYCSTSPHPNSFEAKPDNGHHLFEHSLPHQLNTLKGGEQILNMARVSLIPKFAVDDDAMSHIFS
jgi:hypothetical protein